MIRHVTFVKDYDVVIAPNLTGDDGKPLNACIEYASREIRLCVDLDHETQAIAIWHEGLHSILDWANIAEHNEEVIDTLARGIVQAIRDNPELIATIQGS